MKLYCANCGKRLQITRIALPKYSTIVDAAQWHECSADIIPIELQTNEFAPIKEGKDKFVQSLNDLRPLRSVPISEGKVIRPSSMTGTDTLRDQRVGLEDQPKSSAPTSVLSMIERMHPTEPANELNEPESGE